QSDSLVDTTYASLGASSPQLNDYWFRSTAQCKDKTHDHMSRDDWEDASTCLFPENTWFIKNLPHNGVETMSLAKVCLFLLDENGQRSVWDHALYPQFMYYSGVTGEVGPYSAKAVPDKYLPGDVDLDGDVDADDARTALRVALKMENITETGFINGDIDNDGQITAFDARAILAAAIGKINLSVDEETGEIVTEPLEG
nr:hypothetical protein [Clostridia bacterium]